MSSRKGSVPQASNPPDIQYGAAHTSGTQVPYGQQQQQPNAAAAGQYTTEVRHHYGQQQQGAFVQPQGAFVQPQGAFVQPQGAFVQQQQQGCFNQSLIGHHHQHPTHNSSKPSTASYQSTSTYGKLSNGVSHAGVPTSVLGDHSTSASYPHFSGGPSSTGGYSHGPSGYDGQHHQGGGQIYHHPIGRSTSSSHLSVHGGETTHQSSSSSYYAGSRIVTGEETVIGINTIQGEERVISERIVEHEIKVPKKIIIEEVIEKVIVIPETITREEYVDEIQKITETIIEVAKPIIQEKIIEVQEIEYRDMVVERVEKVQKEKIREVPKIEYQERIVEVPKYITREKIVEVPEIEYRDVFVEKIIEVPEYREQVVIKEVAVPQYVDKMVAEYVDHETAFEVGRNIPVPVEAVTTFEYQLVQFRPRVHTIQYPLYVPRFVEVPVAAELFDPAAIAQLQAENAKLQNLSSAQAVSLCEVENMATEFRRNDIAAAASNIDLQAALVQAWQSNSIQVKHSSMQMRTIVTGTTQSSVSHAQWGGGAQQQHGGVQHASTMPYAHAASMPYAHAASVSGRSARSVRSARSGRSGRKPSVVSNATSRKQPKSVSSRRH